MHSSTEFSRACCKGDLDLQVLFLCFCQCREAALGSEAGARWCRAAYCWVEQIWIREPIVALQPCHILQTALKKGRQYSDLDLSDSGVSLLVGSELRQEKEQCCILIRSNCSRGEKWSKCYRSLAQGHRGRTWRSWGAIYKQLRCCVFPNYSRTGYM